MRNHLLPVAQPAQFAPERENAGVTAEETHGWVREGRVEVWNHCAYHRGAAKEEGFCDEVASSLAVIGEQLPEAAGLVEGFNPPGVPGADCGGSDKGAATKVERPGFGSVVARSWARPSWGEGSSLRRSPWCGSRELRGTGKCSTRDCRTIRSERRVFHSSPAVNPCQPGRRPVRRLVTCSGVRSGVAWPQQAGERLPAASAAVVGKGEQWVESGVLLERWRCLLISL